MNKNNTIKKIPFSFDAARAELLSKKNDFSKSDIIAITGVDEDILDQILYCRITYKKEKSNNKRFNAYKIYFNAFYWHKESFSEAIKHAVISTGYSLNFIEKLFSSWISQEKIFFDNKRQIDVENFKKSMLEIKDDYNKRGNKIFKPQYKSIEIQDSWNESLKTMVYYKTNVRPINNWQDRKKNIENKFNHKQKYGLAFSTNLRTGEKLKIYFYIFSNSLLFDKWISSSGEEYINDYLTNKEKYKIMRYELITKEEINFAFSKMSPIIIMQNDKIHNSFYEK